MQDPAHEEGASTAALYTSLHVAASRKKMSLGHVWHAGERAVITCHSESVKRKSETAVPAGPAHGPGLGTPRSEARYMWHISSVLSLHPDCSHTGCDLTISPFREAGPELRCGSWKRPHFLNLEAQKGLVRRQNVWGGLQLVLGKSRWPPYPNGRALRCHAMRSAGFSYETAHDTPPPA